MSRKILVRKVIVHPTVQAKIAADVCPKCGGELDTGWECNDCGYDAMWALSFMRPAEGREKS